MLLNLLTGTVHVMLSFDCEKIMNVSSVESYSHG